MPLPARVLLAADFDWSEESWIAFVIAGVIGFFYVVMPLLILVQQSFEARPEMIRFDVDEYEWPREIGQLFTDAVKDLTECGFEIVDGLFLPSAVQNVKTALVLLVNRTEQDGAMVTSMYAQPVSATSLKTLYVEFSTLFDDDAVYDTNNSSQLGAFPLQEHQVLHQLVKIKDAATLYQVHQAVISRDGRARSRKVLRLDRDFSGDSVEYLQNTLREEFEAAAERGYLRLSADGEKFRPSVKGAYLMVWKELWPWKLIRKMSRNQRAQTLLTDLAREGIEIDGD